MLAEHEDDLEALWPYGRLLWRFRVDGGSALTREAFDAAVRANPYVVSYLLDPDSIPFDRPPQFQNGRAEYLRSVPLECQIMFVERPTDVFVSPGHESPCDP